MYGECPDFSYLSRSKVAEMVQVIRSEFPELKKTPAKSPKRDEFSQFEKKKSRKRNLINLIKSEFADMLQPNQDKDLREYKAKIKTELINYLTLLKKRNYFLDCIKNAPFLKEDVIEPPPSIKAPNETKTNDLIHQIKFSFPEVFEYKFNM